MSELLPKKKQWLLVLLVGVLLVVIALPSEKVIEDDNTFTYTKEKDYATETEKRLQMLLQKIEGAGNVNVMMTMKDSKKVEGIVIVSDGGDNALLVQEITSIVRALFDVDTHKIMVIDRK